MKVQVVDSSDTNVSKYVFDMGTAVAEAVLYRYGSYEERTVICCSTQSGCPIGCRFCGAGDAFVRSLTTEEIVGQVEHLFLDRKIDPTKVKRGQIMFMSMGEPLLNLKQLIPAMDVLSRRYPNFALLISTSAPKVDFDPAGQDDIGGGCGQLWFVQDWMRNNPEYARPSIGRGLPQVHTPRAIDIEVVS